ncbi:MAG: cysteine--tRNA ligase [Candidatus Electryoneaceae bacterium]|nr:cysteine--tRNA ligase [Candidatus Electryoneaceae bacterium]
MLTFYDTKRRRKVSFESLEPMIVRMYTCGPTVYNDAHIGNYRTYMFEDLLRRTLKFFGYRVIQVMNLTDVDDKTIRKAHTESVPLEYVTAPIIERFFEDIDTLKIERAEHYVAATDHIDEMISLIETLLDKGYAYIAANNVYYSVEKFADYGQLSGMNMDGLKRGVRIDADEYEEKESFRDFALWKGWTPEDGDVGWDAPFGRGRPGWHIECSAMSMKYLGEEFDIHTGGVDNIFPHHENELAQSVVATGKGFVRYWIHSAHLRVDGEKMAKSTGNFFTLRDLLDKGHPPRAIRYVLLTTHYRQPLNYSDDVIHSAIASLERLDTLYQSATLAVWPKSTTIDGERKITSYHERIRTELLKAMDTVRDDFSGSLEDDLGIAGALAALFEFVSAVHKEEQVCGLNQLEGMKIRVLWHDFDRVLGVLIPNNTGLPIEIEDLVRIRMERRHERNYDLADKLRKTLADLGYQLEDAPTGTVVIWPQGRTVITLPSENP